MNYTIAIDGHSSCGKSTLAKDLAKNLKFTYVDTGAMYRSVTLFALQNNIIKNNNINEKALLNQLKFIDINQEFNIETESSITFLNGKNVEDQIRGIEVSSMVSPISKIGFVRTKLVEQQRKMAANKSVIMDGRDIGTVVFPNADLKLFVTASAEIRAKRRYNELLAKGDDVSFEEILHNVIERDKIDSSREIAPLKQAKDAILLNNSNMNIQQQYEWARNLIKQKLSI